MKLFLITALITILLNSAAFSQTQNKSSATASKAERQITALNQSWAAAITKTDAKTLDRLFADEIIVTSGSGAIRDKASEIKDSTNDGKPDPDYALTDPFTTTEVRVKIYKNAAVVTGLAKWAFKYKEQTVNQERRYTHLYINKRGQWRIVAQQISSNLYKKT